MTLLADDPRQLASPGTGGTALRWSLAAATVATVYAAAIWLAFASPDPEGAQGELREAVMIELEPLTAIEETPPPAPEPEPEAVEDAAAEPVPAPAEPPPPEPVADAAAPEPSPPEPVAETPPELEPPPPEPAVSQEPAPPQPVTPEPVTEKPEPPPEPTTKAFVPDLIETNTVAAAVLNPPVPTLRPPAPRPALRSERKPREKTQKVERAVAEKPRRKAEPLRKPDRPRQVAEVRPAPSRSSAARSDAPAASRTASAPRVSSASWQRRAVSHLRKFRRVAATSARGTARVSLTIDRNGRVLSASLASSSGNTVLDTEAVALVRRASPIPAPPEGLGGRTIPITIPINLR